MEDLYNKIIEFSQSTVWLSLYNSIQVCRYKGMSGQFGNTEMLTYSMAGRTILTLQNTEGYVNLMSYDDSPHKLVLRDAPKDINLAIDLINNVLLFPGRLEASDSVYYL